MQTVPAAENKGLEVASGLFSDAVPQVLPAVCRGIRMKRKGIIGVFLACCLLTACGQVKEESKWQDVIVAPEPAAAKDSAQGMEDSGAEASLSQEQTAAGTAWPNQSGTEASGRKVIESQTFQLNLVPFGKVTFASFEPDTGRDPMADAVFCVQRDGQDVYTLPGVYEDNVRVNEIFNEVEAISFPDINKDGFDDIIIICSYSPASGPDVGTAHQEARIYTGNAEGSFTLEKELMDDANSALAVITVQTVRDFLGADRGEQIEMQPWQQAYIRQIQNDQASGEYEGYELIYLDDDGIPELVEIGDCEATGCRIISFYDGELTVTQLNRLYFSYLERESLLCNSEGNMDNYYDLVYRLTDGKMTLIAQGYYGAEDNSHVQFDETGEPIYQYDWNGTEMSREEYAQELNAVFDMERAKSYAWPGSSAEEMIGRIETYR